ncbi:MAG: hypothetical protein ACI9VR_000353 [Cognaticolwellia sp.]|jgi:hypothetical protein
MRSPQLVLASLLVVAWAALNAIWISQDKLVQDGDEMGHVGAAELYVEDLDQGQPLAFLARTVSAEMGDYPPAYAASTGLWWWAMQTPDPSRPSVRAVGLIWLLALGAGVVGICHQLGRSFPSAALAGVSALWLPLPMALGKHFMPEVMLAAACTAVLWAALRQREQPTAGRAVVLGLSLALAVLVKQSALLFVVLPTLGLVRYRKSLLLCALGLLLALPWYANNLGAQGGYLWDSATQAGDADLWSHLLFYPRALWAPALGPVALTLGIAGGLAAWKERGPTLRMTLLWSLGLVPLILLPNKYERLLLPLLPMVPVLFAALLERLPQTAFATPILAGFSGALSFGLGGALTQAPQANAALLQGCPQSWLRAPVLSDAGLMAVVEAARSAGPGPVLVRKGPSFPCSIQTTHPWSQHLEVALRRDGQDRAVLTDGFGVVIVDFRQGMPGDRLPLPQLQSNYALMVLGNAHGRPASGSLPTLEPR